MKLILKLIFSLLAIQLSISAQASAGIDSLDFLLNKLPDSSKLVKLNELMYQNRNSSLYKIYADKLLEESKRQKNQTYKGNALFLLMQYYYTCDIDSMRLLMNEAEPIYLKEKEMEKLFRMKGWLIYALTTRGENEEVFREVQSLKDLSGKLGYLEGTDMADQALADYYYKRRLFKESLSLCEEVFHRMELRNSPYIKRINVIRQIQNMGDWAVDTQTRIYYLKKLDGYINECEKKGVTQLDPENSLHYVKYFYHRFYTAIGYAQGDTALMHSHLIEAEKLVNQYNLNREKITVMYLQASYYNLSGQYEKSLLIYNDLLESYEKRNLVQNMLTALHPQAVLFHKLGRNEESMQSYERYIALDDSLSKSNFYKELAQVKAKHDEDRQALRIKALKLESSRANMATMSALLGILLLSCLFLIYTIYVHKRHNEHLRKAKDKAEESDRLKSAFLSNINHEIRTPLNAIVGFSEVLIEEDEPDLRHKYIDIIRDNNRILQQLIEGILSVSRLESGSVTFNYTQVSLGELMNEVFQVARSRASDKVAMNYIPGPDITVKVDRTYLGQILVTLLVYAATPSEQGVVCLGYTVHKKELSIFIQNTEVEVSEEEQATLFDYQLMLQSWTKGVGLGVNLELAVGKTILERMGGQLTFVSGSGQGTTLSVTFPL